MKSVWKVIIPAPLRRYARSQLEAIRQSQRIPRDVFSEIYQTNAWGGEPGKYYSGPHFDLDGYSAAIRSYIQQHNIRTVLDLACGDFVVGQTIAPVCSSYIGADVVPELVKANQKRYGSQNIRFVCLDMTSDSLPDADLCLILQTLQHLSNKQISDILKKCRKFQHLIISEHQPTTPLLYNSDQHHGQGIRLQCGSGVYLDKPPFNARKLDLLFETPVTISCGPDAGVVRTFRVII